MPAVDAVRGLAVVVMILWHTADGWLGPPVHGNERFEQLRVVGGLAAPAFIFLAGLALALSAPEEPTLGWALGAARRGARIVLGGYALNLWAWTVDRGAVLEPRNLPTALAFGTGLALASGATSARALAARTRAALAVASLAALGLTAVLLPDATRRGPWLLPRLDVLHGIGAALVLTALVLVLVGKLPPVVRARVLALGAVTIAASSVAMLGAPHTILPERIADWIVRRAPWPAPTGAGFPIFPWLAHAWLGAAIARWMRGAHREHAWSLPRVRHPLALAALALVVAALAFEPSPTARWALARADWMRKLFRLVFDVSVIAAWAGGVAALGRVRPALLAPLLTLGRSSLLVYCVHLEFAFGLGGVPLRHALGWSGWAMGTTLLVIAMVGVARAAEELERRARASARRAASVQA